MSGVWSLPLALLLVLGGVVVILAATVIHWLLVVVGLVAIAIGIYLFFFGSLGPI
jgi:hypothetical protein